MICARRGKWLPYDTRSASEKRPYRVWPDRVLAVGGGGKVSRMPLGTVAQKTAEIRHLARVHGVRHLRAFGSWGRGEARAKSDLDLLVDLQPGRDLLDLAGFKLDLEEVLGCRVDVVTERSLSPYLRERILAEARPL